MLRDLRHALRTLARSPGYTTAVILTLALGIGGTTAVFSVLRSVILRPFAWAPADRVMMIAEQDTAGNVRTASYPTFRDWRAGTNAFEALAFVRGQGLVLKTGESAERLLGAFVTDEYFRVLPESAALGRTLGPGDFAPGAPPVAIISWPLWQRRFGGESSVIGRSVTLGEQGYTIVGVMPLGFVYPVWADLWAPITVILPTTPALQQRACTRTAAPWAGSASASIQRPACGRCPRWPPISPRRTRRRTAAGAMWRFCRSRRRSWAAPGRSCAC